MRIDSRIWLAFTAGMLAGWAPVVVPLSEAAMQAKADHGTGAFHLFFAKFILRM